MEKWNNSFVFFVVACFISTGAIKIKNTHSLCNGLNRTDVLEFISKQTKRVKHTRKEKHSTVVLCVYYIEFKNVCMRVIWTLCNLLSIFLCICIFVFCIFGFNNFMLLHTVYNINWLSVCNVCQKVVCDSWINKWNGRYRRKEMSVCDSSRFSRFILFVME